MKKKIYLGIFLLIISFLAGGIYIGTSIDKVTDKLETIITLNKVEFMRENLLNKIVVVQADLLLKDTPHARQVDTFVNHVEEMHAAATTCFNCHHEQDVKQIIKQFNSSIDNYLDKLSRVYTIRANAERVQSEKKVAFDIGQRTLNEISNIVISTSHKTAQRINLARQNIKRTQQFVYIFMAIGPVLIIFFVFFFLKNFSRSLIILNNATKQLQKGDLDFRIKDSLKDEFNEMALSFNEMASSLKKQSHKIQAAERLAAVGEVAAGLAHEVKNPLAGIKVAIDVLKNELQLTQEDKEIFLRVINEINRIDSLLKNLLNYAKPLKPQPDFFNLHDILNVTLKNAEYIIKSPGEASRASKEICIVKEYAADIGTISADPGQVQQIILNLVLNAVDAIVDKGTITVKTMKTTDGMVQIAVSDTGRGIAPDKIMQVFHPFFSTKSKGNGLGLAICKRLVEQHLGTISVSNNPEGGVTFVVTLPEYQQNEGMGS
jgi:signal transduction histidine kinase